MDSPTISDLLILAYAGNQIKSNLKAHTLCQANTEMMRDLEGEGEREREREKEREGSSNLMESAILHEILRIQI